MNNYIMIIKVNIFQIYKQLIVVYHIQTININVLRKLKYYSLCLDISITERDAKNYVYTKSILIYKNDINILPYVKFYEY